MLKKFYKRLIFSGLSTLILISVQELLFAAAGTDCWKQQTKCTSGGCHYLEEQESIDQCNALGWESGNDHTKRWACYVGCENDEIIGKEDKDKVKGCRFTSCKRPTELKKEGKIPTSMLKENQNAKKN